MWIFYKSWNWVWFNVHPYARCDSNRNYSANAFSVKVSSKVQKNILIWLSKNAKVKISFPLEQEMRNGHLFLFFFLQKGKSVFQSFLVSEKLMLASTFCFITENTRHKIWSFINMRTGLVVPQLFLTRPCKITETDFTTAFLGWTSEGKSHVH